MRKIFLHIILLLPIYGVGQDIHFSQLNRATYQINPSLTGTFLGNVKAEMNWKDQWQSINNTFRTYGASAEYSFGKNGFKRKTVFYATGLHFFKDVSGDVDLGNTQIGLDFSILVKTTRSSRLSLGVQANSSRVGIDPSKMKWGSQYNGLNYDPAIFNGEGFGFAPFSYGDVNAGLTWWYHKKDNNMVALSASNARVGVAIYHINRPKYALFQKDNKLPMRFVFHSDVILPLHETLYLYPTLLFQYQNKQSELVFGTLFKYILRPASKFTSHTSERSFSGGANVRITNVIDAIIPQFYFNISNFSIGMSYDVNVSKLHTYSNFRGGFELSLRFINPDGFIHRL
jgi:type IX secretion system PorP/SprF family membrane protein